ncbi:MAG: exo-beta-N-acetylmuramidase NamZ family protein [bacterium]
MKRHVRTGLDNLLVSQGSLPLGDSPAVLCHEASVTSDMIHAVDALLSSDVRLKGIFGPQHGIFGTDQANMVEWEGGAEFHGIPVHSLYGANRKPTAEMLSGISSMIIDLQDVGARYYTYIWTALLCLRACAEMGIPAIVCDRPNPIGGVKIEGPGIDEGFESFVGLANIPVQHGLTIGEVLSLLAEREGIAEFLHVSAMSGWRREMDWPETGLEWINPSPNMPGYLTSLVYPGGCLLEGTNISEGRGTTRPFELVGAPWIDSRDFAAVLDAECLPGAIFRPTEFKPMFDKFIGEICRGIQVHIADKTAFRPVLTYYSIIKCARNLYPDEFAWSNPPYEYEFEKLPIDILAGSPEFRQAVEEDLPWVYIAEQWHANETAFAEERRKHLIY